MSKNKIFTVGKLKQILEPLQDDTIVLIKMATEDSLEQLRSIHGLQFYDYVHTTAKNTNTLEIDACGMSCSPEMANILYLFYEPKGTKTMAS